MFFRAAFASFDLKDAKIYIVDGYTATARVNLTAGYSAGATTMAIDSLAGNIDSGQRFTIAGDTTVYTVTGHAENTSGNTVSITFSPGLSASVSNDAIITFQGHRLEVKLGEGSLNYTERREIEYRLNRGVIDEVREGNQVPVEVSMDFNWEYITATDDGAPTIEDALKNTGGASHWVSSDSDQCRPYAVDIYIEYEPSCGNQSDINEIILLSDFRWEELAHNGQEGTISCTGRCNITTATAIRM